MDSINGNKFPWEGLSKIYDDLEKAFDLDGTEMSLFRGRYQMVSSILNVMIRKGEDINKESYDLLRNFRHDIAIPLLDIYTEYGSNLCLVIPEVQGTFRTWLSLNGHLLFDSKSHMTALMLTMIIEFADLIGSLHKNNLSIENFSMDSIFVNILQDSLPKLYILLTEVKKAKVIAAVDKKRNWDYVRRFMSWCEKGCDVKRDSLSESFSVFIGSKFFTVEKLRFYPYDWDWEKKGQYLMSLVAGDHGKMRDALSDNEEMHWPFVKAHRIPDNLPSIICQLLDWEEEVNGREYNILSFFDYIMLLRNCFKHYKKFPEEIKAILHCQRSIIEMIETLTPHFWTKTYERVGWPDL